MTLLNVGSPKLCALHALLTYVLVCVLRALVSHVPCALRALVSHVLHALRAFVFHVVCAPFALSCFLWYCVPLSLLASAVLCPVCSSSCVSCLAHWISQIFISYTHPKTEISRKFWNLPKTEISKTFNNLSKHKFWLTLLRNLNFFIICQNRNSDSLDNKI